MSWHHSLSKMREYLCYNSRAGGRKRYGSSLIKHLAKRKINFLSIYKVFIKLVKIMQCDKRRGNISLPIKGPQPQNAHLMWQGWLIGKKWSTKGWFILSGENLPLLKMNRPYIGRFIFERWEFLENSLFFSPLKMYGWFIF